MSGDSASSSPVKDFERNYGLSGLFVEYRMPAGETMESMEKKVSADVVFSSSSRDERSHAARAYADAFLELNPGLQSVRLDRDNLRQLKDFAYGVTQGFNADDLDYFLNTSDEDRKSSIENQEGPQHALEDRIMKLFRWKPSRAWAHLVSGEKPIEWHASPRTIDQIHGLLDQRFGPRKAERLMGMPPASPVPPAV